MEKWLGQGCVHEWLSQGCIDSVMNYITNVQMPSIIMKTVDLFQASYFTTLVPLGIVIAFLVKVIPLPGAVDGLLYVLKITPNDVLREEFIITVSSLCCCDMLLSLAQVLIELSHEMPHNLVKVAFNHPCPISKVYSERMTT